MEKQVFKEVSVRIILLSNGRVLTNSFSGDYGGGLWYEDEDE